MRFRLMMMMMVVVAALVIKMVVVKLTGYKGGGGYKTTLVHFKTWYFLDYQCFKHAVHLIRLHHYGNHVDQPVAPT